ncbi:MAG: electron transfer flavoprotein subunit beta/FixA family protein [Deltaproteobacteria bacterium]|nr:MAG: electron transfer flavoprotein subunit beta/FixA family protein [Deltaproteobacteria bacterium]
MNIVVLVKQVPDSEAMVQVKADGSAIEVEDKYNLNFFDSLAVEEALRIKEQVGVGKVTVVTLGTKKSVEALRTGVAMGADEAILLQDQAFEGGDEYATARVLARTMRDMDYDLILCGREAFDDSSGAVGPLVAEFLGIPHVTVVVKVQVSPDERTVVVEREIEGGREIIKAPLPVLISAQKGLNEPRVPPVTGVMKAMRAEIKTLDLASLNLSLDDVGRVGAKEETLRYYRPPERPAVTMIEGEAPDAVRQLVKLLKEEAKAI